MTPQEMELQALRTRVAALQSVVARMAALLPDAECQTLCDWLVQTSMAPDGQEDPSAVTIAGVPAALGGMTRAAEMEDILALVRQSRGKP